MKYKIYCDMDKVLTDFNKAYYNLTGKDIGNTFHNTPEFWRPIDEAGLSFWVDMDWTKDGKELWDYIKKYKPIILSSPSEKNESRVGKIKWVEREIGKETRVILRSARNKKDLAKKNHILIDDREYNIGGWEEEGGIGILHKTTEETIKKLKELDL
jgi:hypothetical protein